MSKLREFFSDFKKDLRACIKKPTKATVLRAVCLFGSVAMMIPVCMLILSGAICASQSGDVYTVDSIPESVTADCIVVLGAKVRPDGSLSDMLRDRVLVGVELYKKGLAPKILMSGDSEHEDYDEVTAMKRFAVSQGVPEEDVICDRYGLSTYDSMWRAKKLYGFKSVIAVTQEYHLYRTLYISEKLGLAAVGVSADLDTYSGQLWRDLREIAARAKDFFGTLKGVSPKYIGD